MIRQTDLIRNGPANWTVVRFKLRGRMMQVFGNDVNDEVGPGNVSVGDEEKRKEEAHPPEINSEIG